MDNLYTYDGHLLEKELEARDGFHQVRVYKADEVDARDKQYKKDYEAEKEMEQQAREKAETRIQELEAILDCRVGKLLKKGKFFVVVAVDEPYFQEVYTLIRKEETDKGTWTETDAKMYGKAIREWAATISKH